MNKRRTGSIEKPPKPKETKQDPKDLDDAILNCEVHGIAAP